MRLEEDLLNLEQNLDGQVVERIDSLKERRDSELLNARSRIDEDRVEIETRREQELEAARRAESETLAMLREFMGHEVEEDITYEPTGQTIVKEGDTVTPKHLESLEQKAETFRNDIAENARREIEMARTESEREDQRLVLEYHEQIDTVQTQLESERVNNRQHLEDQKSTRLNSSHSQIS